MSVKWKKGTTKIPVADFRDFYEWQKSDRYKELTKEQNNTAMKDKNGITI